MSRTLRIVGGALGGLRLAVPAGARPTSERVREALGSVLAARDAIEGRAVLDLFAGSGALGFEMLSRGACSLVAVERDRAACRGLRDNARALGVEDRTVVLCEDLIGRRTRAVQRIAASGEQGYGLILADPPYELAGELPVLVGTLLAAGLIGEGAVVVLEHPAARVPAAPEGLLADGSYRYGDTALSLWVAGPDES